MTNFKISACTVILVLMLPFLQYVSGRNATCSITEFPCNNGQCIQADKYCNRNPDCRDKSDEPSGCTVCNRTFHGYVGFTYALTIHVPTSCVITFVAAGNSYGDVIQLSIPLSSSASASNCTNPLEIRETGNSHHRSVFCTQPGYKTETLSSYYSDSNRLQIQFNFEFDFRYKFLGRTEFPNRGTLLAGTLCSILYQKCENNCTLQTPNYPGLYPNNSTCYYAIREVETPLGLRALIRLSGSVNIGSGELRFSNDCSTEYVVVYDGYSIRDPVLIKFCGNGYLKEIISSGHEMLVQFYSGDNGHPSLAGTGMKGMNLVARTMLISKDSYAYSENHNCLHAISSFERIRGRLTSPVHSLPGNTTCTYYFQGRPNQRVWISFLKFSISNGSYVELWEQPINDKVKSQLKVLADNLTTSLTTGLLYTPSNSPPICEFKLMTTARACLPFTESLVSTSPQLTLRYSTINGTVLEKSSFILDYEFVQNGDDSNCSRLFRSSSSGSFSSPANVLLFGRAGKSSLRCLFRFEADRGQSVRITLNRIGLSGRSSCISTIEPITKRTICKILNSSHLMAKLEFRQVIETTNDSFPLLRDCFCGDETRTNPIILTSTTPIVELLLIVDNMGAQDDHNSFYFDGTYEMLNFNLCPEPLTFSQSTRMDLTKRSHCPSSFYILPPSPHTFLTLKSSQSTCKAIVLHTVDTQRYICLQYEHVGFSPGWTNLTITSYKSNVIIVELIESDIEVNYLQIFSQLEPTYNYVTDFRDTCGGFQCDSIHACIHKSLFCNGIANCPSGEDEAECQGFDYTIPLIVGMGIIITFLSFWICCTRTERKGVG